jgi:translation initiation factor IF-3
MRNERNKEQFRINERINVPEVRLVGDNITTGIYPCLQPFVTLCKADKRRL